MRSLSGKGAQAPQDGDAASAMPRWMARRVDRLEARARASFRIDAAMAGLVLAGAVFSGIIAGGHVEAFTRTLGQSSEALLVTAGLAVKAIEIDGLGETAERDVLDYLGVTEATALPFLNPDAARERVEALPWVRSASVRKLYPATLQIHLREFEPFALWQRGERVAVIDREGTVVTEDVPARLQGLPRLYGHGAEAEGAALLDLLERHPAVRTRLAVAEYVGERRWTLHLDNGISVYLPENGLGEALVLLDQLEQREEIFARSIAAIDLRLGDRVTFRLTDDGIQRRDAAL
ncbi:MAG: cell division protein FtsQ/DivIB, partial [Hyphomicrobiaceae bacterium]|nr:cell division protein FtsQ/DivIB [Hyphomicrobiaceae bacterium]